MVVNICVTILSIEQEKAEWGLSPSPSAFQRKSIGTAFLRLNLRLAVNQNVQWHVHDPSNRHWQNHSTWVFPPLPKETILSTVRDLYLLHSAISCYVWFFIWRCQGICLTAIISTCVYEFTLALLFTPHSHFGKHCIHKMVVICGVRHTLHFKSS